jgi:HEPN domain-containing protein
MSISNIDIEEWVSIAQADYDYALKTSKVFYPVPIEMVCYHCQQSVEKVLKAYTLAKGDKLIKTHDLIMLINMCKQHSPDFDKYTKICSKITSYVAISRYPPQIEITKEDMKIALSNTRDILEFTKSKLEEMGYEFKYEPLKIVEPGDEPDL